MYLFCFVCNFLFPEFPNKFKINLHLIAHVCNHEVLKPKTRLKVSKQLLYLYVSTSAHNGLNNITIHFTYIQAARAATFYYKTYGKNYKLCYLLYMIVITFSANLIFYLLYFYLYILH